MKVVVKVEGLRECERALSELPKATGKNVLKRIGRGALEDMRTMADTLAPVADEPYYVGKRENRRLIQPGRIKQSIAVSEKRTRRAKGPSKNKSSGGRWRAKASTGVDVAMGPSAGTGALYNATRKEFGNIKTEAEPYMRPAWDAGARDALEYVKDNLWAAINKAAAKVEKKRVKAGK